MRKIRLSTYGIIAILVAFFLTTSLVIVKNTLNEKNKAYQLRDGDFLYAATTYVDEIWKNNFFRSAFWSKLDALGTYCVTGQVSSSQVVRGTNGWLFYAAKTDSDPIGDYEGTTTFTSEEVSKCVDNVGNLDRYCNDNGINYCLLIVPNKENVYYEYMPDMYLHSPESRTDKLAASLIDEGYNVINLKDTMISAKGETPLYYLYDTHWNQLGAYLGVKSSLESMGLDAAEPIDLHVSEERLRNVGYHYCGEDDLAQMTGLRDIFFRYEIERWYEEMPPIDWIAFQIEQESSTTSHLHNEDAVYDGTLLLVRDSFGTAMMPALSRYFKDVYVEHIGWFKSEDVAQIRPDYVIFQYVERYSYRIIDMVEF